MVIGHWSRLFPSETSWLCPFVCWKIHRLLLRSLLPQLQRGSGSRRHPAALFFGRAASCSSYDFFSKLAAVWPAASSVWCLVRLELLRQQEAGQHCVYFLERHCGHRTGTLAQSWTLGPGRASTAQAPGETILFFAFSSSLVQSGPVGPVTARSEISSVTRVT